MPLYVALIVCVPCVSVDVENDAWAIPFFTVKLTGGCAIPSMENVTAPVGVALPDVGATIAVSVTVWATVAGLGLTAS